MKGHGTYRKRPFSLLHWLLVLAVIVSLFAAWQVPRHAQAEGTSAEAGTTVRISPLTQTANVGDTVTIEVWVDDVTNLGGYQFTVNFDPNVLHATGSSDGGFLGSTGRTVSTLTPDIDNDAGTITVGAFTLGSGDGPSGSGKLATVTFSAVGGGTSALSLSNVQLTHPDGSSITVDTLTNGSVDVTGATSTPAPPTATPEATSTGVPTETPALPTATPIPPTATPIPPTATPIPGAMAVSIDPASSTQSAGSTFQLNVMISNADNLGSYQFTISFDPSVMHITGASDGGFLGSTGRTVSTVGPTMDNTAGKVTFGAYTVGSGAGPGGNGVLAVLQFQAVGAGTSPVHLESLDVTDAQGNAQNPDRFDGSVTIPGEGGAVVSISPLSPSVCQGDTIQAEVRVSGASNLGAFQFTLTFDPSVVNVASVALGDFLGSTGRGVNATTPSIDNSAGILTYGAYSLDSGTAGPSGSGVLAVVTLQIVGKGISPLNMTGLLLTDVSGESLPATDQDSSITGITTTVSIQSKSVLVGADFDVDVDIMCASNLGAYQFTIGFDPNFVQVNDVTDGGFLGSTGRTVFTVGPTIDNTGGEVTFGAYTTGSAAGPSGFGVLAVLHMHAVAPTAGAATGLGNKVTTMLPMRAAAASATGTYLSLESVSLTDVNGENEETSTASGRVVVSYPTPTPTTVPGASWHFWGQVFQGVPGDTSSPISGVTMNLYGSNVLGDKGTLLVSKVTDSSGNFFLVAGSAYKYYTIEQEVLPGMVATGAQAPSSHATVVSPAEIRYADVSDGYYLDNFFWQAEPTPTPTPTETPTATPTSTPTATPTPNYPVYMPLVEVNG